MKWEQMQKPLREGMQVFRMAWADDLYVMAEDVQVSKDGDLGVGPVAQFFSGAHPEGVPFHPSSYDLDADDWAATGPSGT